MSIFQQTFTTGQVVAATGVSNATLQSWLKRDLIVGHKNSPIEGGGSPGIHRRFSFFNVMEIALAKGLSDLGLSASEAFQAASRFAHSGSSRVPSLPFDSREVGCFTLLCTAHGAVTVYRMTEAMNGLFAEVRHQLGGPDGFLVLHVNPIFERVCGVLGYDYRDVLDDGYGHKE